MRLLIRIGYTHTCDLIYVNLDNGLVTALAIEGARLQATVQLRIGCDLVRAM